MDTGGVAADPLLALRLRNGVRIDDALKKALEFVERDGSYATYDLAAVAQDNELTESDIRVANAMIARMSTRVITEIHARAPAINAALADIPAAASLAVPDDAVPWGALENLMQVMDGIPDVRLARQTKVLHKKRPALIPILDSVVQTYLLRVDRIRRTGTSVGYAMELIGSYKRELDLHLPVLQSLRSELGRRGISLTECRLLDLFLWAYSGTYTPPFQKAEPGASNESTAVAGMPSETHAGPRFDVSIFRDDEDGYLDWLAAHPAGFVLNAARSPGPSYLILHRAACRTISGRPTRGGPWTGPYIKICSADELHIAAWAGREVGGAPKRCGVCLPRQAGSVPR